MAAKRNYRSDKRLGEKISYQFDGEYMTVVGESFHSRLTWDKIHKVTESNDFILIWQNRQIAHALAKTHFSKENLQKFKELVGQQLSVKNNLK